MTQLKITDSYRDFFFFRFAENSISLKAKSAPYAYGEIHNPFFHSGLFLENANGTITYHPGTYDASLFFYKHPLRISDDLYLINIQEKNLLRKSPLGVSKTENEELFNPKGFQIHLKVKGDHSVVDYTLFTNNDHGIYNAANALYYFDLFLKKGNKLDEFNADFGQRCTIKHMETYPKRCYIRIYDFVAQLRCFSYSEVFSRTGKDNRIESGIKIVNESMENYFIHLLDQHSGFKSRDGRVFTGKEETDYGYIPSSPYLEREITGFDKEDLHNELINILIKKYVPADDMLYTFFIKPKWVQDL